MTMTKLRASLRAPVFVLAVVAVTACSPMTRFHGFAPDARELAQVQVGQTTRADVVTLFGAPTSDGGMRSDTIYYVVRFDTADLVRNVTRYTLQDGRIVHLDRRVTDDGIEDIGVLEQLLGSFGRIDAGTFLGADDGGL